LPGEHGHFLSTLLAALQDPSLPLRWPVHDRRGITDVSAVVDKLPAALLLPAGVYNFGAANDTDMYTTVREVLQSAAVRAYLQNSSRADPLQRLVPDCQTFADAPRDIRMDPARTAAAGIVFETTKQGLCAALENAL
jgi:dTDP-4-dehydrorhamnose reductase